MRWAEFMGPPGVGKSTLFKAVCRRGGPFIKFNKFFGADRSRACSGLKALVDDAYNGSAPGGLDDRRLRVTHKAMQKVEMIDAAPGRDIVLMDELLCQRGLSLALSRPHGDAADRYFEVMPLPAVVFMVLTSCDTIRERNAGRAHAGGRDRSDVAFETHAGCLKALGLLTERSAKIHVVDAALPVERNAGEIVSVLCGL